jgi:protocatechuate 3,4-dioxygenase beta subunit
MSEQTRRGFLVTGAAVVGSIGIPELAEGQTLAPTPECRDGDEPTIRQTEGPYFKPHSPQRSDLREPGLNGNAIEISGLVLTRACRPVERALIDLWHADANGDYDDKGYRCRGHVFTDAGGRYSFRTIIPAVYPGRTRHFHVKVQAPNRPVLTTQLYFPNEGENGRDGLFRPQLLMRMADAGTARFNFVLDLK